MDTISHCLAAVKARIAQAADLAGRQTATIHLLAVSKTKPSTDIRAAYAAGQCAFGENYLQEALEKMAQLADLPLEWHFIGPIQSNKTRFLAEHFAWVHSVDRLKIAERLSAQRPSHLPPLQICLQVNISQEASKQGCDPSAVSLLAQQVHQLPNLQLRGLMAIPAPSTDVNEQRRAFRAVRELLEALQQQGLPVDTLSMGMSDDLEAAIAEGATWVRVGSYIFGARR